jgi:N-methylhydantoinase A
VSIDDSGRLFNIKVLTTPADPSRGVLDAIEQLLRSGHSKAEDIRLVVHATTLASNALLTGKIPKVALVTTKGFRDVIEIGRQNRPELYNLQVERPRPLVPRKLRFEIEERVTYHGTILKHIDPNDSRRIAQLVRRSGSRSVAVCFLHSYANSTHEKSFSKVLRKECPRAWITLSSELLPEFREYERTSTTVVNACLQPIISSYLEALASGLKTKRILASVYMMQSNGGTISYKQAIDQPARVIESGPVAGAVAAKYYGRLSKAREIISLDVGGTTSKAGVWVGDRFELTTDYEVGGRLHGVNRLEGSGYPVRFPLVDLVEVGTGGGSIAKVDSERILHVGPQSAGASPGPSCYGLGGEEATVTDANLVLGRLNPDYLLGGGLRIHPQLARKAIERKVARSLGMTVEESALSVLRIAIDNMSAALRAASVERGKDPRGMLLVAFGGAGPMHACELARQLGIRRVLIPRGAGLFSSLGLLLAEPLRDFVQTVLVGLESVSMSSLNEWFERLEGKGARALAGQGVSGRMIHFERFLDLRYSGQGYELSIPIPRKAIDRQLLSLIVGMFHKAHFSRYGHSDNESSVELVNLRVNCRGNRVNPTFKRLEVNKRPPVETLRPVGFLEGLAKECPVYTRGALGAGFVSSGPAVLEDYDSTLVIPARCHYKVDTYASVIVTVT